MNGNRAKRELILENFVEIKEKFVIEGKYLKLMSSLFKGLVCVDKMRTSGNNKKKSCWFVGGKI